MDEPRRRAYLQALGVQVWTPRAGPRADGQGPREAASRPGMLADSHPDPGAELPERIAATESDSTSAVSPQPSALPAGRLSWDDLRRQVASCTACELQRSRTQTVFGMGDPHADLLIIGEAPGADEDRQGEPFVGRAGQLLNAMLHAIGLQREQVFIANILKCRPPGNRNPSLTEVAACQDFLARQIELVAPRLILSVGAVSAHNLLDSDESVGRLRRRVHSYGPGGIPLLVTYHPAYLLRRPEEKAKAWEDLQRVAESLGI